MSPEQSSPNPESSSTTPSTSSPTAGTTQPVGAPLAIASTPSAPYGAYPAYPAYPPPSGYYVAPPSQPIAGTPMPMSAPSPYMLYAPYQAPNQASVPAQIDMQLRRRRAAWPIVLIVVGSLLVVALVVGGLYTLVNAPSRGFSHFSQVKPPNVPVSLTNYSTPLPGPCDPQNPDYWQRLENTRTTCASTALAITNPADAPTLSEVDFQPAGVIFPVAYKVSVDASSATNACVGIGVLRHDYTGYSLFVCPSGYWEWNLYSVTGLATRENYGNVPMASSYRLEVDVSAAQVSLLINGKNQLTTSRLTNYTTNSVGLEVEPFTNTLVAIGDFSNFAYAQAGV